MTNENALSGYFKTYRSIINWEWFKDQNTLQVFLLILALASFKDSRWQGVEIKKGQLICSRATLQEKTGLSEQSVKTALNHLKSTNEITIKPTNRFSLITVVNYTKYQEFERLPTNEITNEQPDEQPTDNQQITNSQPHRKNVNTLKPVKSSNNTDMFDLFWQLYPKKAAKAQAEKSFAKINPDRELLDTILKAVEEQKRSKQWLKDEGQFIPMPATWLNQRRWEDVVQIDTKPQLTPQQEEDMRAIFG